MLAQYQPVVIAEELKQHFIRVSAEVEQRMRYKEHKERVRKQRGDQKQTKHSKKKKKAGSDRSEERRGGRGNSRRRGETDAEL